MSDTTGTIVTTDELAAEVQELRRIGQVTAAEAETFLGAVTEVAAGSSPDIWIPVLLLALSRAW